MFSKKIEKKILPEYFNAVTNGSKRFELRKDEDDAQVGDLLILKEWNGREYTGRKVLATIVYVLRNVPQFGLQEGYAIYGIQI